VARNVAALGAQVALLSVTGRDEAGDCLTRLLKEESIKAVLHHDPSISTTIKLRVIGRQQQLLRIDFETQPSHEVLASALADFEALLPDTDVVILSDYGKGGLAHIGRMIELAGEAGKPVLVDPKGDDYARYRNATLLTPNRSEFRDVAGSWKSEEEFAAKAQQLRRELNLQALRRQRRRRHRDRDPGRDAGEWCGNGRGYAHRQPRRGHRGGQAWDCGGAQRRIIRDGAIIICTTS
jgi:rfaE bifunctional protein kinase chain/domain